MGHRCQVKFIEPRGKAIYLYSHWGAYGLEQPVLAGLEQALDESFFNGTSRANDTEYLARIIFNHMQGGDTSNHGFGIGTEQHGDIEKLITIYPKENKIEVNDIRMEYDERTDKWQDITTTDTYTFGEFQKTFQTEQAETQTLKEKEADLEGYN